MAPRRRPQSFRGLVREYLPYIEYELERGIDCATVMQALGIKTSSARALRDAMYHARRRARARKPLASVASPIPPLVAPSTIATKHPPHPPMASKSKAQAPSAPAHPKVQAKPRWGSTIESHRDFLELMRSTDDSEIL